jgi:hypothetical protein
VGKSFVASQLCIFICQVSEASLSAALRSWQLRFIEPERLADLANQIRIQVMVRSCQRQLCGAPLAVDYQMSMALAVLMSARVKMAPAQPLSERVDFHCCSPVSLGAG